MQQPQTRVCSTACLDGPYSTCQLLPASSHGIQSMLEGTCPELHEVKHKSRALHDCNDRAWHR